MSFSDTLTELGLSHILDRPKYFPIELLNSDKIYNAIDDFRQNNLRVLIYGDYDTDGCMCIKEWILFMNLIGHHNYEVYEYTNRMHTVDPGAVRKAIEEQFDYIIISDSGSSELGDSGLITKLLKFGVKVVVIDHHYTPYNYEDYPVGCSIVNNIIENRLCPDKEPISVSAGALVFLVLDYYLHRYTSVLNNDQMSAYALISLYADSIDMSSTLNRSIYYKAMQLKDNPNLPIDIQIFLESYNTFSRRFIEFNYTPKINCCFRNEVFGILNDYLATNSRNVTMMTSRMSLIKQLHIETAENIELAVDNIEYELLDNFVIGSLNTVSHLIDIEETRLYNFTGLIANKLAERHGKCGVVFCARGDRIQGSFRDLQSRNYLPIFKQFCKADGHPPAFGFSLSTWEYSSFMRFLIKVDKQFFLAQTSNRPIVVPHEGFLPSPELLGDVAKYNEFSGSRIPMALVSKTLNGDITEVITSYGYKYRWGNLNISSKRRIEPGEVMLIKPFYDNTLRLTVI